MKALQLEARPARAKPALGPKTEPVAAPAKEVFTACELEEADQLLHLSESSSSSGAPRAAGRAFAATPPSSSLPSVNTRLAPAGAVVLGGCADWEEENEHEVVGSQRRVKRYRYRLIAKIYAATEEIGGRGSRNNKKEHTEDEIERERRRTVF